MKFIDPLLSQTSMPLRTPAILIADSDRLRVAMLAAASEEILRAGQFQMNAAAALAGRCVADQAQFHLGNWPDCRLLILSIDIHDPASSDLERAALEMLEGNHGLHLLLLADECRAASRLAATGRFQIIPYDAPISRIALEIEMLARRSLRLFGSQGGPDQGGSMEDNDARKTSACQELAARMTGRQYEVLSLVVLGLTNKEIAAELGLSQRTVKAHLTGIFGLLGARNRTEATTRGTSVLAARRAGINRITGRPDTRRRRAASQGSMETAMGLSA